MPNATAKIIAHAIVLTGLGLGCMAVTCVQVDPTGFDTCRRGAEGCACRSLGTPCDTGLQCNDGRCEPSDDQVPSMADLSTGEGPSEPESSEGSEGSEGSGTTTGAMNESDDENNLIVRFDVSPSYDMGNEGSENNEHPLRFIWIPNTNEDTISKIDVETRLELERHRTAPPGIEGAPARVSVNRRGEVVVANRHGGVVKFHAADELTPHDSSDGRYAPPWHADPSRAWYQPLEPYTELDALAWTPGRCDSDPAASPAADPAADPAEYDQKVWVAANALGRVAVYLLDGETGEIEHVFDEDQDLDLSGSSKFFGAAVDAEGTFWGIRPELDQLISIDLETHEIHSWSTQADVHGIAVDHDGSIWTCAAAQLRRLTPNSETWISVESSYTDGSCVVDGNGTLWVTSSATKLLELDHGSLTVDTGVYLDSAAQGISIDLHGNLWAISEDGAAHRFDPNDSNAGVLDNPLSIEIPAGAATHNSDMTGFTLRNLLRCPEDLEPAG